MNIASLSCVFSVRKLNAADIDMIYALCSKNEIFYQYHPPFVTKEHIAEDMHALAPGKNDSDKFFVGFFEDDTLVAVLDLVLDYPEKGVAFIGFFMMNLQYQNRGVGSGIITECAQYLKRIGFNKIRLGVDKNNPQSNAFWKRNGFLTVGEAQYIIMELALHSIPL